MHSIGKAIARLTEAEDGFLSRMEARERAQERLVGPDIRPIVERLCRDPLGVGPAPRDDVSRAAAEAAGA